MIVHGTTVATNAALEGKAHTAYIANEGMKDVIRIGRQTRKTFTVCIQQVVGTG